MKVKEIIFDIKTGQKQIIERELTQQEINKNEKEKIKFEKQNRISEINQWFAWYDNQVKQYERCQRLGIEFDKDMVELDHQADAYQKELRNYKEV